jgi:hypothetical protein
VLCCKGWTPLSEKVGKVVTRYDVNDSLTALANQAGIELTDEKLEELNELTHLVSDFLGIK